MVLPLEVASTSGSAPLLTLQDSLLLGLPHSLQVRLGVDVATVWKKLNKGCLEVLLVGAPVGDAVGAAVVGAAVVGAEVDGAAVVGAAVALPSHRVAETVVGIQRRVVASQTLVALVPEVQV